MFRSPHHCLNTSLSRGLTLMPILRKWRMHLQGRRSGSRMWRSLTCWISNRFSDGHLHFRLWNLRYYLNILLGRD